MAFGAVDLVIGYDPQSSPRNDCERQGHRNVGCLPAIYACCAGRQGI